MSTRMTARRRREQERAREGFWVEAQALLSGAILDHLRAELAAGRAHLASSSAAIPDELHSVSGWTRGDGDEWTPGGDRIGYLSADASEVLILAGAVSRAVRALVDEGVPLRPDSELCSTYDPTSRFAVEEAMATVIVRGTHPGAKPPRSRGYPTRSAGYVLPAYRLGIRRQAAASNSV